MPVRQERGRLIKHDVQPGFCGLIKLQGHVENWNLVEPSGPSY